MTNYKTIKIFFLISFFPVWIVRSNLTFNERFAKDLKIISALKQWEFEVGAAARETGKISFK